MKLNDIKDVVIMLLIFAISAGLLAAWVWLICLILISDSTVTLKIGGTFFMVILALYSTLVILEGVDND